MPRWYQAFRCRGKPQQIIERISSTVQLYDLGRSVPMVRVEKRARGGEFYLFLAIESQTKGQLPLEAADNLHYLFSLLGTPLTCPLAFEEIRSVAGAELDVHDYTRRIPYWRPQPLPDADPFGASDTVDEVSERDGDSILQRSQSYDRLLLWLSATGAGSFAIFQSACMQLGLDVDSRGVGSILRRLRLLGHLETSRRGKSWSAAPCVLVKPEHTEREEYFVCGRRDMVLLKTLRELGKVAMTTQTRGEGPALVSFVPNTPDVLLSEPLSSVPVHVLHDAASQLAHALPTLDEWMNTLDVIQGIVPSIYAVKRYNGSTWVDNTFQGRSGFYQLWHRDRKTGTEERPQHLFYDATHQRWLHGDWYGLRYLALGANCEPCVIRYEAKAGQLAILRDWRWPELYERTLVLASGLLPTGQGPWLVYRSISRQLLDALRPKLNLEFEDNPIYA